MEKAMTILILIGLCAALIAGMTGYAISRAKIYKALAAIGGALIAVTGVLYVAMDQATGWDGLIYVLIFIGGVAPAAVGGALGAVVGWFMNRKSATIPA
jgi:hypothetical protein